MARDITTDPDIIFHPYWSVSFSSLFTPGKGIQYLGIGECMDPGAFWTIWSSEGLLLLPDSKYL